MAITTLDGVIAGFQAPRYIGKALSGTLVATRPWTFWAQTGVPGVGAYDTTLDGVTLSSTSAQVAGQIPHADPASTNAYLARFQASVSQAGVVMLCDRLWHNGGYTITSTSGQNSTTPTWPARDTAGSTNGDGILLALEVSANVGAGTPTITIGYTNQAGTASRTATNILTTVASPIAGSVYLIGLQAGDSGVRSVQSLTLSATWTSGTINLAAYRLLAAVEVYGANSGSAVDAITGGFTRIYNGTVPYVMFYPSTTTASALTATYVEAHG